MIIQPDLNSRHLLNCVLSSWLAPPRLSPVTTTRLTLVLDKALVLLINIISTVTTLGCLTLVVCNYCHLQECGCPIYASVSAVYCKWHSSRREEWLSQSPSQTQVPCSNMEGYEGQQKALTPQIHLFHQVVKLLPCSWNFYHGRHLLQLRHCLQKVLIKMSLPGNRTPVCSPETSLCTHMLISVKI